MKLIQKMPAKINNKTKRRELYGLFECPYCQNIVEKRLGNGKKAKSCGCRQKKLIGECNTKHGMSKHRLYLIWSKMKARCKRANGKDAKYYFNKGVTVCDEWKNDFVAFANWALSNGYFSNLVLDRKKGSQGYSPGNCQWVTIAQNNRNKCSTKLSKGKVLAIRQKYSAGGVTQRELANEYDISTSHICSVIKGRYWNEKTLHSTDAEKIGATNVKK